MHCFFVSESSDGSQNIQWGDMTDVIYSIGAIALQCCLYASLASLIGVWTRSAAIAVGSSLVLYFLQMIFEVVSYLHHGHTFYSFIMMI